MAEIQKTADQAEKPSITKTAEAAKEGGVIAAQPNQEVHGKAFEQAHQNDKTLSEPDMIAMNDSETVAEYKARVAQIQANRFGFFDSEEEKNGSAEETGAVIDYQPTRAGEKSYASGLDYEEGRDTRSGCEKLADFVQAAAARASDPEGKNAYIQGQLDKIIGIGEGLNIAKDETKAAVVAGYSALTDGTVAAFLSKPNAINEPLFKAVGGVLDAMAKDPNAVNHALEKVGTIVMNASEHYSAATNREKGHAIGETMFAMVNPEGSTEAGQAAVKVADALATQVDKAVIRGIQKSVKAAENMARVSPELAQTARQMLFEYTRKLGLSPQEMELAGIPKGYFDGMPSPSGTGKGDNLFAMSKADDLGDVRPKRTDGGVEREPVPEKLPASERFNAELKRVVEGLPEGEQNFLQRHGIEIKPVRRITDKYPDINTQTAGCFDASEKTIYVAEEVFSKGEWIPNTDVPFMTWHEFGHAFNAKAHQFGEFVSNRRDFIATFKEDLKQVPVDVLDALQLSPKYRTIELARDEVFADMYAHASKLQSNNSYSQLMKQWFPTCLKYLEEMPKW